MWFDKIKEWTGKSLGETQLLAHEIKTWILIVLNVTGTITPSEHCCQGMCDIPYIIMYNIHKYISYNNYFNISYKDKNKNHEKPKITYFWFYIQDMFIYNHYIEYFKHVY